MSKRSGVILTNALSSPLASFSAVRLATAKGIRARWSAPRAVSSHTRASGWIASQTCIQRNEECRFATSACEGAPCHVPQAPAGSRPEGVTSAQPCAPSRRFSSTKAVGATLPVCSIATIERESRGIMRRTPKKVVQLPSSVRCGTRPLGPCRPGGKHHPGPSFLDEYPERTVSLHRRVHPPARRSGLAILFYE